MIVNISNQAINQIECAGLVLHIFDEKTPPRGAAGAVDWLMNGFLSRLLKKRRIRGKDKEIVLLPSQGRLTASKIIILGLGKPDKFNVKKLRQAWEQTGETVVGININTLAIAVPPQNSKCAYPRGDKLAAAMIGGLLEGISRKGGGSRDFHLVLTNFNDLKTKENKDTFRQKVNSYPGIQSIGF